MVLTRAQLDELLLILASLTFHSLCTALMPNFGRQAFGAGQRLVGPKGGESHFIFSGHALRLLASLGSILLERTFRDVSHCWKPPRFVDPLTGPPPRGMVELQLLTFCVLGGATGVVREVSQRREAEVHQTGCEQHCRAASCHEPPLFGAMGQHGVQFLQP